MYICEYKVSGMLLLMIFYLEDEKETECCSGTFISIMPPHIISQYF